MKLRILKILSKPKDAIGVSLLDVISNALASIILLFFVFSALRGQPLPPERVLGILIIDYKFSPVIDTTAISIYVNAPSLEQKGERILAFDSEMESRLTTISVDTIPGVWNNAIILTTHGVETKTRRLVYMNPPEGMWQTGIVFADHSRYTSKNYSVKYLLNNVKIKAYFINPNEVTKVINLNDFRQDSILQFPTQKFEMGSFRITNYNF